MRISLIAAVARNGVIGRDNELPWRLSADLKRFRQLTMGHHVIMGRRTYESIGRPLPGRKFIVVSRNWRGAPEGVTLARSVEEALRAADGDEVFILGGSEIFRLTLPVADRLYLTRVEADVEGDVHFPEIDPEEWVLVSREELGADEKNDYPTTYLVYDRR